MEQQKSPQRGKINRNKGHIAERLYAKHFRDLGYEKCITSREGSKLLDSCKVDLMFLPFLIQIKAGRQSSLNSSKVLQEMQERITEVYPEDAPELSMPKFVIHHKDVGKGKDRTEFHQIVSMTFSDFVKLLNKINK